MFRLVKVRGNSLSPYVCSGDFVLTSKLYSSLEVGHLVVVDHALYGVLLKKVLHIAPDGQLWLGCDENKSLTSERIGWVSSRRVIGKVILRVRAPSKKASSYPSQ